MNDASMPAEVNRYIKRVDEQAARDLKLVKEVALNRQTSSAVGASRNGREPLPGNNSPAPTMSQQHGEKRGKAREDLVPHFELVEQESVRAPGVYWCDVVPGSEDKPPTPAPPIWVCSPLRIGAITRDAQGSAWGRLLLFRDADGREHRWACPQSLHARGGEELRETLLREGLIISTDGRLRRKVGDYIQQAKPTVRALSVDRTGWHGDVFVLPRETLGSTESEMVIFQSAVVDAVPLQQSGTLSGWINSVSARCAGNTRLVAAISMGFAAPCLGLMDTEGGGVHLRGPSSSGKSTALAVATSIYGPPAYAGTWRATDNGLEGIASLHSDLLLVLDEIGQLNPKHAGQVAYLLANGQGKSRSHRDGSPRPIARWRSLFLSAGEVGLSDLVTQAGEKVRAGQEVRVLDVPADAGMGLGLFNVVADGATPSSFADELKAAATRNYGCALPAFLQKLVHEPAAAREQLQKSRDTIAGKLAGPDASGQVRRAADRFALIGAAGELATTYNLTGWTNHEAELAVTACFEAWIEARDGKGNSEPMAMVDQVRAFLETHGEARFTRWDPSVGASRTINRAGFRKDCDAGPTFFIGRECFRNEVCKGFDYRSVARVLSAIGALQTEGRNLTRKERLPDGRNARVFVVTPALWSD